MRNRHATIALVCAAWVAAVGLGVTWGLGQVHVIRLGYAGGLAVMMLGVEGLRSLTLRRLRTSKPLVPWICLALGGFAVWLMCDEAFLWYTGDSSFIRGLMLMLPFLLALSPLIRSNAWLGAAGSALFLSTSLAMLISNGFSRSGGYGFFVNWVS